MLYASDLKKAKPGELVKAEAEWRETVERQVSDLADQAYFPESIHEAEDAAHDIIQLARNVEADAIQWEKVAKACRAKMRVKETA